MSEQEKKLAEQLMKTLAQLPETAKAHWLGYAEGVADMAAKAAAEKEQHMEAKGA